MGDSLFIQRGRILACVILFVVLFFSQSCQHHDDMAKAYPSISIDTSVKEAFSDFSFVSSSWVDENWWEMFQDKQLNQIIEVAFENNPSLQMAVERVSLAHDKAKQSFAPLLPSAEATFEEFLAGFNWNQRGVHSDIGALPDTIVPKWINILSTLVNFRWNLDLWGKQKKLYQAAIDETKMQMAEAAYTKLMLSTQIALAYFDLQYYLSLKEQQALLLNTQNQILDIQNSIYEHALGDEETLQTLEKSILSFQNEIFTSEQNIEVNIHELKMLMGKSADDALNFESPTSFFGPCFPFPEEVPIGFLSRRADVVAKIWAVQAASKRIKSAEVAFLPSIDLGSFSGYFNLSWDTLLKPRGWFTSIAPMATLPIFKGLELRNNLQQSVKRYNLSILDYNQVLLKAAKEVVDSITTFRISNRQLICQEEVLKKSQNLVELSTLRYEYGLNNYLDVLKTKLTLLEDEINMSQYNRLHMLAALSLIKSLGGGYQCQELVQANEEIPLDE
ncbi:MAG: Outer membrane protein OprM [Chlamydiae bacterium]|nr:Outer membrane protein OprM [Chlamydiota bacterium]